MPNFHNIRWRKAHAGFSVLELALVLIITAVVGIAVWAASSAAWQKYRFYTLNKQILMVVSGIRERYAPQGQLPTPAVGTNITNVLDAANLIPNDMRNVAAAGVTFFHDFGGAFSVTRLNRNELRLDLAGLDQPTCVTFVAQFPIHQSGVGIRVIGANGGNSGVTNVTTTVTPANAIVWCNQAGNGNTVNLTFSLWS